jgi:hypothetical protein
MTDEPDKASGESTALWLTVTALAEREGVSKQTIAEKVRSEVPWRERNWHPTFSA